MKMDSFVQLIKDLRQNSMDDDTDPSNVVLQVYTSPFDTATYSDSVRVQTVSSSTVLVWGNGTTYTAYDNNGNPYQAPSCGWLWGSNGRWG